MKCRSKGSFRMSQQQKDWSCEILSIGPTYWTSVLETWQTEWNNNLPPGGNLVHDWIEPLSGFKNPQGKTGAKLIHSESGCTVVNLHWWGCRDYPICPSCGIADQDMGHLILPCSQTDMGGSQVFHDAREDFCNWLAETNIGVWKEHTPQLASNYCAY